MEPTRFIWFDGELVPWGQAQVHVLAHGLHYGTGAFEGIRVYATPEGPAAFRLGDHMRRMVGSAKAFRIPLPWSAEHLSKAALEVVRANELPACYLRPIVFLGTGTLGINPTGASVHTAIAAWEWGAYLGKGALEHGARVRVSSWRRIGHEALIPNAKGTGQYINSVLAKQEAITAGYDEALLLNYGGYVAEGSGQNVFLVKDDRVGTPPSTAGALEGITRDTVMTLLADDGHDVVETMVTRSDLYYADEVFFTGTAAEVTPIREIDDRPVGDGKPGPVTARARELFMKAVTGELAPYRHWLEYA
ncbi:MAG: branched-chain amino acid transaminase [Actinomycetota bacterium]|jgi:branched-chain amino acid aminotransferase|nr:branched-chain amino acid transaminase [Actinomycetota bacterium]